MSTLLVGVMLLTGCGGELPAGGTPAEPPAPPASSAASSASGPFSTILNVALHEHDGLPLGEPVTGPVAAGATIDLVAMVRAPRGGIARSEVWLLSEDGGRNWSEIARASGVTTATRESLRVTTWTAPSKAGAYHLRFRIEEATGDQAHADHKDATFTVR